jgi:hypothetical protein
VENSNAAFYQSSLFGEILSFMQKHYPTVQMKEVNQKLTLQIRDVATIQKALHWVEKMESATIGEGDR